jgi:hypothetical protein
MVGRDAVEDIRKNETIQLELRNSCSTEEKITLVSVPGWSGLRTRLDKLVALRFYYGVVARYRSELEFDDPLKIWSKHDSHCSML